jgi:outer membrane immunogenic protein
LTNQLFLLNNQRDIFLYSKNAERGIGRMKILATIGVIALCLLASSAQAADSKYDWSGIYLGASAGYAWGNQDWTFKGDQFWADDGDEGSLTPCQFDAGGHIGAQYQWRWLVLGGEAGIYKGPYRKDSQASPFYPTEDEWTADISLIAKGTGRVGFAFKRLLTYVKGGYAGGLVDTRVKYNVGTGVISRDERTLEWHNGWTAGGGIEYAITNHVIIGAEYNYIDLGSQTHTFEPVGSDTFNAKVNAIVHQALFRLSFKF